MPAEASAPAILSRQRRIGLRVALAVAVGLTFQVATGATIPFMAPLFAVQFLIFGAGPLPLSKAIGFAGLVLVIGLAFIALTSIFSDRPAQMLALLGLFFFTCFFIQAQGRGGSAIFISLVIAIMVVLLDGADAQLDTGVMVILLQGCLGGVALSWLAHAVLPSPDAVGDQPRMAASASRPAMRALANTAILLGAVTFCLTNSAFALAIVLPITITSLLLQLDLAANVRSALGLVAVNLLSGILASLAFAFVELRPSLHFVFLTVLLVGLFMGGRAAVAPGRAPIYAGALTTFLILFGTGISPLPASTPESFSTRIGYVLLAVTYALCMTSLLWPREPPVQGTSTARQDPAT